jgi:predicted ATPase/signal transduction histidine kinase
MDIITKLPSYQLMEQIYIGTRTLVYKAIHTNEQTNEQLPVVIKLLKNDYPPLSELLKFRNQYTITKNLDSPHIVKSLNLEACYNTYALIMEDFGGISLSDYLKLRSQEISNQELLKTGDKSSVTITLTEFFNIALQLTDTLHYLYQNRVIHKDIKPDNILINPDTKQVKLIDFSISSLLPREIKEIQNIDILEGTLAYISPEQTGRMNRGIDYRSDFYSLGITFYELLTGNLPFVSKEPMELIHCHLAKQATPIHQVNEQIPLALSSIVSKLMAKNAEDRYQSALGLKHDLQICWDQFQSTATINIFKLGERDLSDRFTIPEKLYGREKEVIELLNAFERVSRGRTEMMLVAGLSGVGKTVVVHEIHKPITRRHGYFIQGKFDQFNRNIPLSAFVQAFRDLIRQLLNENDQALELWRSIILQAVGENGQVITEVIPELEQIIGVQSLAPELSGNAAQNRFNLLFQKFIQVFTKPEHPLVIFLDDLQWADSASLSLIQLLMSAAATGYLLLIGAYRHNEISATHPLMLTLDLVIKSGTEVNTITLEPLDQNSLNYLVADTLSCDDNLEKPLAELIYQKTQGNPFFVTQFLKALHQEKLIEFDVQGGYWRCDIAKVREAALTDDVIEFMGQQLQKLPIETQEILKLAACIGNQFDLSTLAIVSERSSTEVATALWTALQAGLILPISEVYKFFQSPDIQSPDIQSPDIQSPDIQSSNILETDVHSEISVPYKFLHDRVQQATYSLIDPVQKRSIHFHIGTLLLENLSDPEKEERIFEIVNHLNLGNFEDITSQPDLLEQGNSSNQISQSKQSISRKELARLNLLAGIKAKSSIAYIGALMYITTAMDLLPVDHWQQHYDLSFVIYKERAEVEYLNGNFQRAERWLQETVQRAKTPLEKAEVYNMIILQYTLQANYPEAIQAGRQGLALVNVDLPKVDLEIVRDRELAIVQETMQNRSFADLANLPIMTQPEQKMAIKLLISMGPPTYRSHQKLWSVICIKAINLCLQYGNTPEIGYIYPSFGSLRGYALNNYQNTEELLQVTLQLIHVFNNKSAESVAYLMIGSSLRHWSHPLSKATEDYLASYQVGLESSNLQYAAYAFGHNMYCRFYQSIPLDKLFVEISESLAFSRKYKNQWAIDLFLGGQIIISKYMGIDFYLQESAYLEQCHQHKNWQVICIYNIFKSQLLFFFDQIETAFQYGQQAEREIINVAPQGLLPYVQHCFIYSLLLLTRYPNLSIEEQSNSWQKVSNYHQLLELWAKNNPVNFQHLSCLVTAEMARVSGDKLAAIENYDRAITIAKTNKYVQEEALANELAAKFYLNWGKEKVAAGYMQEAYYCYVHWEAKAKVIDLENRYPQLLMPILQQVRTADVLREITSQETISQETIAFVQTSTSISESLDLATLLKASQAISGEIELDQLLTTILEILIANAGATKCVLLLKQSLGLEVVALVKEGQSPQLLPSIPLELSQDVAIGLVNNVKRSKQPIVLADACISPYFATDIYLQEHQPRSVICSPVLSQGNLIGILYLENNLTTGVFTSNRIEILNLISAQAAISLENVRLYQSVQQAFSDLKQAQLTIVQSEKMSALGNLVAGIAHEINNPIGFLSGNIQPALDYINDVLGLVDLYERKYPQPDSEIQAEIETIDLDYIREDLPKLVGSMREGVKRIQDISNSLRTFSRADSDRPIKCNIHDGIDSTIMILKHRLKANETRPEIQIIKDYGNLPQIECYAGQLNQVFMNILANAIDALEEANVGRSYTDIQAAPNQITVSTEVINLADLKQDQLVDNSAENLPNKFPNQLLDESQARSQTQAVIHIRDNGAGMSEAVREKIFDDLFTTKGVGKGTGLGLAIAQQVVVEKHHGQIQVKSELGSGTEFIINLPI